MSLFPNPIITKDNGSLDPTALQQNFDKLAQILGNFRPAGQNGPAARVTALPSNPWDGMEVNFVVSASAGIEWRLVYRAAASGSYKWEVIGGPPLIAWAEPGGTVAGSVADLSLAIPLAGDYIVDSGIRVQHNVWPFAARINVKNPSAAVIQDQAWIAMTGASGFTRIASSAKSLESGIPAGTYTGDTEDLGNNPSVYGVWMQFTPVRVG